MILFLNFFCIFRIRLVHEIFSPAKNIFVTLKVLFDTELKLVFQGHLAE